MGNKVTISNFSTPDSSSFITKLNNDLDTIENEFDKVVYQDGSVAMEGDLDFGSNRLYNLPFPMTPTEPIRVQDVEDFIPVGPKGDPGSPGEGYADRVSMAAAIVTALDDAYLTEDGREGKFIFDSSNLSAFVTADPSQGIYIPLATDATGASGAWRRRVEGGFRPEWFGAKGDGVNNDTEAFARMSALITFLDGGVVELRPGATYMIGSQTFFDPPQYTYYTFSPTYQHVMDFVNCANAVIIRGNGATLRCVPNLKYGTFNTDGTPMAPASPYYGAGASTPYYSAIHAIGCTGGIHIEHVELDGNLESLVIGGKFGDTGTQLSHTGVYLEDIESGVFINGVNSHHHGQDGIHINGTTLLETDARELAVVINSRFDFNGRQGMSFVGGKGWNFTNCTFNWTGRVTEGLALGPVVSPPGAGVDFEAEARLIRDVHFDGCEFIGNYGAGLLHVGDVKGITAKNSRFIGVSNWSIWADAPGLKLDTCLLVGTMVYPYTGGTGVNQNKWDAFQMDHCVLSNSDDASPIGTTYVNNNGIIEGGSQLASARNCKLIYDRAGSGGTGNADGIRWTDCEFFALQGNGNFYGRFCGHNLFVNTASVPSAAIAGYNNAGPSEGTWTYRTLADVETNFGPTVDGSGNILKTLYTGIDADYTFVPGTDAERTMLVGPQTATRTFTVSMVTKFPGARFRFLRTALATGAFDILIKAGAGGATIFNLGISEWVEVEYINDTLGWTVIGSGPL